MLQYLHKQPCCVASGQGMQAQGGLFNTKQQQAGIIVGITIEGNKLHIKYEMLGACRNRHFFTLNAIRFM